MKRFVQIIAAAGVVLGSSGTVGQAQATDEGFSLKAPIFVFQPGGISTNVINKTAGSSTNTALNLRFVSVVPTTSPWVNLLFGTQIQPVGFNNNLGNANDPQFFYGNIFPVITNDMTGGYFSASVPVYGLYTRGGGSSGNTRDYGNDLAIELALSYNLGAMMMKDVPGFSRSSLYLLFSQAVTNGRSSPFSPAFIYGISIPIGK